jgi:hypothetical protein
MEKLFSFTVFCLLPLIVPAANLKKVKVGDSGEKTKLQTKGSCELQMTTSYVKEVPLSPGCGGGSVKLGFVKLENGSYLVEACYPKLIVNKPPQETHNPWNVSFIVSNPGDPESQSIIDLKYSMNAPTERAVFDNMRSHITFRTFDGPKTTFRDGTLSTDCNIEIMYFGKQGMGPNINTTGGLRVPIFIEMNKIPVVRAQHDHNHVEPGGR